MDSETSTASGHLRTQWDLLDGWLRALGSELDRAADRSSVLDGWTVGELVSHLGRALGALARCTPVPPGTVPLTFAEYIGSYPERADEITAVTRELDHELAADRLGGVERMAAEAFTRLDELATERVVQARRGPITLRDMVVSRVVELVVHADDLARSLPAAAGSAVDRAALDAVADELLRVVVARGGWSLEIRDPLLWTRLATGREPYDVDRLALALVPVHTSEAVPDLGRMLPLL
ncbi:maleylpyruvate isomerase N-terminal domain-containing protein [Cellulosimicrobium marinum]|uniref:maleylpyruvate isomerase N-terminal domain-containing protein n=1 Tax=Cellulosimicrobium marinum TaxID=1638992 RepID=UPI001E47371C|nr:maleylpyruvate isomerase N-terminal domain-containing protein [Cellulosimicrobium marinum]MCB7136857.1 maleylpyruvate isomerase N-terminal domain-containing protein [Cellulosimicrobium marinum]